MPHLGHAISDYEAVMCLWAIEDEFIQSGSTAGLHTGCLESIDPPSFVVPETAAVDSTEMLTQAAVTAVPTTDAVVKPIIATSIGELVIEESRWVDEVNGVMPEPGEKLLLITIGKAGQPEINPETFPLEAFDRALRDQSKGEVHISGDDGSYAVCSMAGWVGDKDKVFAMGFRIADTAKTIQLFWPDNQPVDLFPMDGS